MACPHCGSWAVRSDRALAGRMVCARCGQPLGLGASQRVKRPRGPLRLSLSRGQRLGWAVAALLLVSAGLASLDGPAPTGRPPAAWETGGGRTP